MTRYSLATVLRLWRAQSGCSQAALEDLSIRRGDRITQQQIARWESGQDRPQSRSLQRYTSLLAEALRAAGYDGADAHQMWIVATNASKPTPTVTQVSEEAALLDAQLSTHSAWNRSLIWLQLEALVQTWEEIRRRAIARDRQRGITPDNNPDEE
jgi:transcriptional regulator with XRE-family HTH domain